MQIYQIYQELFKKYGDPKDFWAKWCKRRKTWPEREEIAIGAILTQRTNWRNVELALKNLEKAKALSIEKICQIGKRNMGRLEDLIKPSGFYKQKAKRLFCFCEFIVKDYGSLKEFFKQDLATCRKGLLKISGIGPETADSILLYAGEKLIFVIDEYTRRFVKKHHLSNNFSYPYLQQLFQENLPKDLKVYQDFHAMIVLEGKGTGWNLQSSTEIGGIGV
ncbi:MAG: hypothetical protein QME61_03675 [Patescibacteria group bacterium]|nr:hypothetical protein [Patescibacteria group bacterium]